ncbi:hypothetical protein M0805_005400 [Coniferiporia weirii]|nr:hypothetical protein M0805_005400 [Coniferiporia weirii]
MNALGRHFAAASTRTPRACRSGRWNDVVALPSSRTGRRSLHSRRELQYPIENGVGGFLPPPALKTVVEWQDGLLDRLNEQVKDTSHANKPVLQTIIDTAAVEESIMTYNYACLAANNSFFLDSLKPPPEGQTSTLGEISVEFNGILKTHYKDLNHLRDEFVSSAMGMASSGWLWLVTDGQNRLAVLPTFGAGTLLVRSRVQLPVIEQGIIARQLLPHGMAPMTPPSPAPAHSPSGIFPPPRDGPSLSSPVSGVSSTPTPLNPHTPSRSLHISATNASSHPSVNSHEALNAADADATRKAFHSIGARVYPLLCLSVHEHAWVSAGLGVWGKEEYVRRFFSVVNWKKVGETFTKFQAARPISRAF